MKNKILSFTFAIFCYYNGVQSDLTFMQASDLCRDNSNMQEATECLLNLIEDCD